jgi:protein phosphatase
MLDVRWGAASDVGRVRRGQEDDLIATGNLFAVADGMGGHLAGEVASQLAVDALRAISDAATLTVEAVTDAITRASDSIQVQANDPAGSRQGMGTTLVGLALVKDGSDDLWLIFNIGDSRLYRFADGELLQVTVDHSEIQELVESGTVSHDEARTHPQRNVITRALGSVPPPVADLWLIPPVFGERYVLCSDGLTGELRDEQIAEVLTATEDPQEAARLLTEGALEAGGRDNVSVIVVDVVAPSTVAEQSADETTVPRPAQDHLVRTVPAAASPEAPVPATEIIGEVPG